MSIQDSECLTMDSAKVFVEATDTRLQSSVLNIQWRELSGKINIFHNVYLSFLSGNNVVIRIRSSGNANIVRQPSFRVTFCKSMSHPVQLYACDVKFGSRNKDFRVNLEHKISNFNTK